MQKYVTAGMGLPERPGPPTAPVTVPYATANRTALVPDGYTATDGTLASPLNATSKTTTLPLLVDKIVEGREILQVSRSRPTGAMLWAVSGGRTTFHAVSSSVLGKGARDAHFGGQGSDWFVDFPTDAPTNRSHDGG